MPLFPKIVVHFGFFTNEMECERSKQDFSNKVIVLTATSALIFQFKNGRKIIFKKYSTRTIGLIQLLQKQICEENR